MTIKFTRRYLIATVVLVAMLIGLAFGSYQFLLQPKKIVLQQKQAELQLVEEELEIIGNRVMQLKERIVIHSLDMQKEVPVKPLLDQLLLDIDRAEYLSNSRVSSVGVASTEEEVSFEATRTDEEDGEDDEIDEREAVEGEEAEETIIEKDLPRGMQMIRLSIQAEADHYLDIEKFIDVLQTMQRVIRVDSINFSGGSEITAVEDDINPISYSVNVTAFYYPTLTDLLDELPKMDTPPPASKRNPFASFSDSALAQFEKRKADKEYRENLGSGIRPPYIPTEPSYPSNPEDPYAPTDPTDPTYPNEPENPFNPNEPNKPEEPDAPSKPAPPNPSIPEKIIHTVQAGDTLYKISMTYFGSRDGEQKIMDANNMKNDKIHAGQVLHIPINKEDAYNSGK